MLLRWPEGAAALRGPLGSKDSAAQGHTAGRPSRQANETEKRVLHTHESHPLCTVLGEMQDVRVHPALSAVGKATRVSSLNIAGEVSSFFRS